MRKIRTRGATESQSCDSNVEIDLLLLVSSQGIEFLPQTQDFPIPISLELHVVDLRYFKL